MDTNGTSVQAEGLQVLKGLVTAVEALTHDTSFKYALAVVEEGAQLRKQIDSQQAEVEKLAKREKDLIAIKETAYQEMFEVNEKEKLKNAEARKNIGILEAKIHENEQIIAELKKTKAGLESEVKEANRICDEEKKKLNQANEDFTKLQKVGKEKEKLIEDLKTDGSKLKRAYESLKTKSKALEADKARVDEEIKQKSLRLQKLEGYAGQLNDDSETVLCDKMDDLWDFCTNAILVHLRKDIPEDRLQDPQAMRKLKTPGIIHHQVPLPASNTNVAKKMRLAIFMGLLARELVENIFQPLYITPGESEILSILHGLAEKDPEKESYCRAILLAMSPEKQNTMLKERKKTFLQNVGSYVYDLLPGMQYDELRQSLKVVLDRACETWRFFQYSRNRYEPDFNLLEWGDEECEAFPFEDNLSLTREEQETDSHADEAVLAIFPRICRLGNGEPKSVKLGTVLTIYQCSAADRECREKEPSSPRAARAIFDRQRTRGMSISLGGASDQKASFLGNGAQASK